MVTTQELGRVSIEKLLFSHRAAERILKLDVGSVHDLKIGDEFIYVLVAREKQIRVVGIDKFAQDFNATRQHKAKSLIAYRHRSVNQYLVVNPEKNTQNTVELTDKSVKCTCLDYQNQNKVFQRGCCKHGYKILNSLGFNTIDDYLNAQKNS